MTAHASRTAMIGLDAADLDFIRSEAAALPTLRRLLAGGALHRLASPADLLPGAVWPTFYTGTPPGEHGIYHHLQWDASSMRLRRVAPDWLYCEPFWCALERRGARVVAVDVPMTLPSRLDRGVEVTNWGSHDQLGPFACQPRALAREILGRFGSHAMGCEIPVGKSARELRRVRDNLIAGARQKAELVRWLLNEAPWDFLIAVFGETHRGGHILWPGGAALPPSALLDVYRAVDAALGEILAAPALRDARLIVFSLHGMGPNLSQEHFVPAIMDLINARFLGIAHGSTGPAPRGLARRLRERVPGWIQNRVARMVPVGVRDAVVNHSIVGGHDWAQTPGLDVLADLNGYLRLNVRGREGRGILEAGSEVLARYVALVRHCFSSLRVAGSGEALVEAVHASGDFFTGRRAEHLPDLVVTWAGCAPASMIESPTIGRVRAELATGRSGNHRRDGFCVISGPGAGEVGAPADIRDLASIACRLRFDAGNGK